MKKFLLSLIALLGVMSANAQEVTIEKVQIRKGKSGTAELVLNSGGLSLRDTQFEIQLPEGITVKEVVDVDEDSGDEIISHGVLGDAVNSRYYLLASNIVSAEGAPQLIRFVINTTVEGAHMRANGVLATIELEADPSIEELGVVGQGKLLNAAFTDDAATTYPVSDVSFDIEIVEDRIIFDEAATTLPSFSNNEKSNIRVIRTMKANQWSTIVLPFTITSNNLKVAFGDDAQYAYFSGWSAEYDFENEDYKPKSIEVNFKTKVVVPNVPGGIAFLVKPSKDVESFELNQVTLTNVIDENNATDKHKNTRSDADGYGLTGVFKSTFVATKVPADGLYISGEKFYYSTGETNIKGFRGWFELGAVLDKDSDFGVKMNIYVDGEETAIDDVHFADTKGAVYTIDGKFIGRNVDVKKLQKGIYVIDGKKIAVK